MDFYTKLKKTIFTFIITSFLLILPIFIIVYVIPVTLTSEYVIAHIEKSIKTTLGLDLNIKNPVLKLSFKPAVSFCVDELSIEKDNINILTLTNFATVLDFKHILYKEIALDKFKADNLFLDIDSLIDSLPKTKNKTATDKTWKFIWIDSLFSLNDCHIKYSFDNVVIDFFAKDVLIPTEREPKHLHFDITANLRKDNNIINISLKDNNNVYIKDHKMCVDKGTITINESDIFFDAQVNKNNEFNLLIYSNDFRFSNLIKVIQSDLIIPNGKELLSYYSDFNGSFNFYLNISNKNLDGYIAIDNLCFKLNQLNNLPITIENGLIHIYNDEIILSDFVGYYATDKSKKINFAGTVKDYTKSVETSIDVNAVATNELMQNYISSVVGFPIRLTGDSKGKIIVKSKYSDIDVLAMFKLAKGDDVLFNEMSLSPINYDRAFYCDFHLNKNILDIKSIKYYIANELTKDTKGIVPIVTVDGQIDLDSLNVNRIGFDIPKPLPSEILNLLIGQNLFKKGYIDGRMHVINDGTPHLSGHLQMEKVFLPAHRMSIKLANLVAQNGIIHANAKGRFKRSLYEFSGDVKNELIFPIIVKDINLKVDNIDVEKLILSMNQQEYSDATNLSQVNESTTLSDVNSDADLDNENANALYTFNTGFIIVEKCMLNVIKGVYKDIHFANLLANLTLNKDGILEIKSNRFDFAEGISSLKVLCDLQKHDYHLVLGVKDINSDLIASSLLNLKKEISGKASGFILINTDDTLKLNGTMKFVINNGFIQKVGLVEYALNFASLFRNPMTMISPSTIFDIVNIPDGSFETIDGDLLIKNNVVERILIKTQSPLLSSFIIGSFDLETRDASLRIYTKFSNYKKGIVGLMRNISLNSFANKIPFGRDTESMYYSNELEQIPPLQVDDKYCQVFLTKVDGDIEKFNFISSLKKIK